MKDIKKCKITKSLRITDLEYLGHHKKGPKFSPPRYIQAELQFEVPLIRFWVQYDTDKNIVLLGPSEFPDYSDLR